MAELIGKCACSEPGCEVGTNGECFNQLPDPEKCSHFYWLEDEVEKEPQTDTQAIITDKISLISGDDLEFETLTQVTHNYDTKIIVLVGESESGKTTLLSSIYDIFQLNGFVNNNFAGSLTQIGFERRCHKSRKESKLQKPETDKTGAKKFSFLHIAMRDKANSNPIRHYLLSDISGEKLSHASSSTASMQELDVLKFADLLIVIVDGEKIAEVGTRQTAINKTIRFLQKAIDEEMISVKTTVCICISKMDLLESADKGIELNVKTMFESKFKGKILQLLFNNIAARPKAISTAHSLGSGIENLLGMMNALYVSEQGNISRRYGYGTRNFENFRFGDGE